MKTNSWFAVLLAAGCLALQAQTSRTGTPGSGHEAIAQGDRINVRGQASLKSEVIGQLNAGDTVTVLDEVVVSDPAPGEPARWLRIAMPDGINVWVHGNFVDPATRAVTASRLNVRTGPSENHSIAARLDQGARITEIKRENGWIQIQAPENAYAYVAAEFFAPAPGAMARSQTTTVPPDETAPVPETVPAPVEEVPEVTEEVTEEPPIIATAPAPTPAETIVEASTAGRLTPDDRRSVKREGVVRNAVSIQAPTDFELEDAETGRTVNYIRTLRPEIKLNLYKGFKVIVTGEESIDKRWPRTPVLTIESIELP
jgi:uncharacterized protein YgiM (DUF1202 family)